MQIKTILVATDFSEDANSALDYAVEFSKVFESKLRLVHAYQVDTPAVYGGFAGALMIPQDILEPIRQAAEASIEAQVKELAATGVEVKGRAVNKNAVSAILEEAEQLSAGLIVMGTRGLTGLKHVLVGSTAERTVRLARCPVVTVKAKFQSCAAVSRRSCAEYSSRKPHKQRQYRQEQLSTTYGALSRKPSLGRRMISSSRNIGPSTNELSSVRPSTTASSSTKKRSSPRVEY